MRHWQALWVLFYLIVTPALGAEGALEPQPPEWTDGNLRVHPHGFLEVIGMSRSATTADSVSTHFGNIPLADTPAEGVASIAHSRLMLNGDYALPKVNGKFAVYLESDFLNSKADAAPFRWRQYWGAFRLGGWELLGGQAWSLMRPDRVGVETEKNLMNTDVIDPAYHVGIVGARKRQVRLSRALGKQHAALVWESNGDFEAKLTTDRGAGHFEIAGLTGHQGRRAVQVSGVINVMPRLRLISQQFVARRAIGEALGLAPVGISGFSTLEGAEVQARKNIEIYSYAGMVYANRSAGNRLARQYTAGFNWKRNLPAMYGALTMSLQYSYLDRAVWDGRSGMMNFVMYRMRYTIP